MSFNPIDYDIPDGYRHWQGDTAEDYIGPFFFYMEGEDPRTAFRVQARHCNAHQTVDCGVWPVRGARRWTVVCGV